MASTGKCPFCDGVLRSDEKTCPHCGAINASYIEDTPRTIHKPRTIDELKEYCAERGMPLLRMRFFIGEDYKEPKAFGIYRDGKNFVVYKNKADGSRAVRYQGPNEAHAVDELFQKLLSECHNRGIYPDGRPEGKPLSAKQTKKKDDDRFTKGMMILIMTLVFLPWVILLSVAFPLFRVVLFITLGTCILYWLLSRLGRIRTCPPGSWGARQDLPSGDPLTRSETLRFTWKSLFYSIPEKGLSIREQRLRDRTAKSTKTVRLLLSLALALAVAFSLRGYLHRDDGYYVHSNGDIYYSYGDYSYKTGAHLDDYEPDTGGGYSSSYLGDEWDEDWGEVRYSPPTLWDDLSEVNDDSFSSGGSGSDSWSSSSDRDSWSSSSSSDYETWNSDDTDWDSDW